MSLRSNSTNVIITGVGGQGNVLAARLLASAALAEGHEVTVGDVYGLTQRGGSVASHVRWTKGVPLPPLIPRNSLNILVAFEPLEGLRVLSQFGNKETVAVVNDRPIMPIGVQAGRFAYPDIEQLREGLQDLTKELILAEGSLVAQKLGNIQILNLVMLGALFGSGFISLDAGGFEKTMDTAISKRHIDINRSAFQAGIELAR